ncbi:DUF177 domain-containing protein [Aquirufa ecclesiirivi]|uniref:DUF177 domain-containing protein n=1 Tax=Aquirufa ecclesiirivi TaxID=2715124 RepID=A0ABT4JJF3_9BACT|nr:DUF177 domain-containing protein [Aquirufa ecclesiirivi]MCZ2476401.1 DUF177 domain-containing protein [Aquirufa ecclesiirivi]
MTNFAILFTRETMKVLDAYQIPIISLEDKSYRYSFEGGDEFLKAFEQEWVQKGKFQAEIELSKSATMIQVLMKIKGYLNLICDRSNEEFEFLIDIQEKLIYKYGDHFEDLGDNLFMIDRKEPKLDLSQDLYDFIALQVPMKKLHPRFVKPADESAENEFLYTTAKDADIPKTEEESMDPRWAVLKKLTDNH